jgi:hypothetical protein
MFVSMSFLFVRDLFQRGWGMRWRRGKYDLTWSTTCYPPRARNWHVIKRFVRIEFVATVLWSWSTRHGSLSNILPTGTGTAWVKHPCRLIRRSPQVSHQSLLSVDGGIRGSVRPHQALHDPHEFREGVGSRLPPAGCHQYALLGGNVPERSPAVGGQVLEIYRLQQESYI